MKYLKRYLLNFENRKIEKTHNKKNQASCNSDARILIFGTRKTFFKILKYGAPYVSG